MASADPDPIVAPPAGPKRRPSPGSAGQAPPPEADGTQASGRKLRFPVLRSPRFWAFMWAAWFVTLFILSSMSQPGPKIEVKNIDKVEHALVFACGGAVLALCLHFRRGGPAFANAGGGHTDGGGNRWRKAGVNGRGALIVLLTGAAVGWFDEWHQTFTPGRSGLDVDDWKADITGSLLAVPLAWVALKILKRRRS